MKKNHLTLVLGQLNFTVGAVEANAEKIYRASVDACRRYKADMIIFPELSLSGYPAEDLWLRPDFLARIKKAVDKLQRRLPASLCTVLGFPEFTEDETRSKKKIRVYNSAVAFAHGEKIAHYRKRLLPNQGVFDEQRYFSKGRYPCVFTYKNHRIGLVICEDLWHPKPAQETQQAGADFLISLNASPFHAGKLKQRQEKIFKNAQGLPVFYINHCGGQDDLVFDGSSFVLNKKGEVCARAPLAQAGLWSIKVECKKDIHIIETNMPRLMDDEETKKNKSVHKNISIKQLYDVLLSGLKDYALKNNFKKITLGLSGGIDSALVLTLACDALGNASVLPVFMPSCYTSAESFQCVEQQCKNLDVQHLKTVSIDDFFKAFIHGLQPVAEKPTSLVLENIQARLRGMILMALSNQEGALLLNTSNKSELAVGYGTLYGDMCGGFAPIKDLWKTQVYALARYRNTLSSTLAIPDRIIDRAPSAELSAGQKDTDTLPPYALLDRVLKNYIEKQYSIEKIIQKKYDEKTARKIVAMVKQSEYKRHQAPLGTRVSTRAFTRERRYPITSGFEG